MSALDDAIAAHMAHPAGSMGDPLSDSLAEQQACTQPAPVAESPALREGWENEPVRVPRNWKLYLLALLLGMLGFGLGGCSTASSQQREVYAYAMAAEQTPRAALLASCPPLTPAPETTDVHTLKLLLAEREAWYRMCREEALQPAHRRFRGWQ